MSGPWSGVGSYHAVADNAAMPRMIQFYGPNGELTHYFVRCVDRDAGRITVLELTQSPYGVNDTTRLTRR